MDAGSCLMISFLDLVPINIRKTHGFHGCMLCRPTKVTEATAAFRRLATVKALQYLRDKGMRVVSIVSHGLSSQRAALSDEDPLNYLRKMPSATGEFPDVK
jgi:hypothetical protein